ncbi:MAG TPA: serine/threonine-protein kinase, partial [Vicinamibacteria bacterium]|nr:serine/threonine-protein kinase [Vicinamibacteria bacterium]
LACGRLEALADEEPEVPAGRRIGRYEVVGELGRGGMGIVLRVVRADDADRQPVALKLVPQAGVSGPARRRFLAERQILAALQHPHIARFLDGGATEDGLPFLVMELVEGEPIDRYCDRNGLGREARLRLFLKVADAVEHAHCHRVVHRDIKPANVLVTAAGEPKLLDFGIARLLEPGAAGETALTVTALRMLTPEYASPEQLQGDALTTATDVYSLGVLLHLVLTGRHPRQAEGIGLRGDLDKVVLKALRQEPAARYPSVQAFAEDLRRHLAGRPVWARRPTLTCRARRLLRCNPAAAAAGALALLALLGGMGATAWESRRADEERRRAERLQVELGRAYERLGDRPQRGLIST